MKKIIIIAVSLLLFCCKETKTEETISTYFYFDEPQPINDSELSSFPSKFRGIYSFGENSQLHIEKKYIYNSYLEEFKLAKTALDSFKENVSYKGSKIVLKEKDSAEEYNFKNEGDSLYLYRWRNDTVFRFSPTQKAKRVNGQLVLSSKDSIYWQVRMLSIKKDTLSWKYFTNYEDYISLRSIVKDIQINTDTTDVHLKPTRKEFTKILLLDSLATTKYRKVKS